MVDNIDDGFDSDESVDLEKQLPAEKGVDEFTPKDLAKMTKGILGSLAGIFILFGLIYAFCGNGQTKEIFEFLRTFVPSIVTLVLGVHYGVSSVTGFSNED